MNLEEQLIEWGRWCRWSDGPIGPRGANLVSSVWRGPAGRGAGLRNAPSAVVGERVQHAVAKMLHQQRRPELGKALGAWYAHANFAVTTGRDPYFERVEIAATRCGVSPRTFGEQLVQARTALARELDNGR